MKKIVLFSLIALGALFQFCSSPKNAQTVAPAKVTFASNVQPIIQNSCSPCHIAGQGKATPLNSFDAAKAHADEIVDRIKRNPGEKGFMPMRHPKLSDSTINVFVQWKEDGLTEK